MSKKLITGLIILTILFTLNVLCYGVRDPFASYIQEEKSSAVESTQKEKTVEGGEDANTEAEGESAAGDKKELTAEDVRTMVPFKLLGIINSGDKRRVLLDTGGNTEIIKNDYSQDGFELLETENDSILIRYKDFYIIMKVGGDIVEIKK